MLRPKPPPTTFRSASRPVPKPRPSAMTTPPGRLQAQDLVKAAGRATEQGRAQQTNRAGRRKGPFAPTVDRAPKGLRETTAVRARTADRDRSPGFATRGDLPAASSADPVPPAPACRWGMAGRPA